MPVGNFVYAIMVPQTHRQGEKEDILVVVHAILPNLLVICSFNRGGPTVQNEILPRVPYYPGLEHAGHNKEGIFFNQNQHMIAQKNRMIYALNKPEGTMIVVDFVARFYGFRGAADPQFGIDPYGYVYDGK